MADSDFTDIGFAVGLVRGARTFRMTRDSHLMGVYHRQLWRPGLNYALCRKKGPLGFNTGQGGQKSPQLAAQPDDGFAVPERGHIADCRCGFYGYYDGSNDYRANHGDWLVEGVVEGWGETVIGKRGFRCTVARIVALTLDQDWKLPLSESYGVPVFDTFDAMVASYPPVNGLLRPEDVL